MASEDLTCRRPGDGCQGGVSVGPGRGVGHVDFGVHVDNQTGIAAVNVLDVRACLQGFCTELPIAVQQGQAIAPVTLDAQHFVGRHGDDLVPHQAQAVAVTCCVVTQLNHFHPRDTGFDRGGQVCVSQVGQQERVHTRIGCDGGGTRPQCEGVCPGCASDRARQ